jgi:hypothetical protein
LDQVEELVVRDFAGGIVGEFFQSSFKLFLLNTFLGK